MRWVVVDSGGCNSPVDPVSWPARARARAPYVVVVFESVVVVVVFESVVVVVVFESGVVVVVFESGVVVVVFESVVVVGCLRWRRR